MRKLAVVLTVLAALTFLGGFWRAFLTDFMMASSLFGLTAEGYWRGTTALLLFAVVVLMLDRKTS